MTTIYAGTSVQSTATFENVSGTATDPSTIICKFGSVGGGEATTWTYGGSGSITKVSTGVYQAVIDTTVGTYGQPGPWICEWIGTGTCATVDVANFTVQVPPL